MQYNVYIERCPSRNILEVISDKWSILILGLIAIKPRRFGELKREVDGISAKMLTQTLRLLEKHGFVKRVDYQVLPLKIEYHLTSIGSELNTILSHLTQWTMRNMEKILEAEEGFKKAY